MRDDIAVRLGGNAPPAATQEGRISVAMPPHGRALARCPDRLMRPDAPDCCEPGDITISEIPDGFLIGRNLPKLGLGPWWEYVGIVRTRAEAIRRALAETRERGRVWMQ